MINQLSQNENTQNQFSNAIRELHIGKMLLKSNISKTFGVSAGISSKNRHCNPFDIEISWES